jgi:ribosome production factor 2
MGPSFDLTFRRFKFATNDVMKEATRVPKELKPKKVKSVQTDTFSKTGTLHIPKQEYSQIATKKMKGLKKRKGAEVSNNNDTSLSTSNKRQK